MATTPGAPQTPKSRGLSLFDRQAQLHAYDSEQSVNTLSDPPLSVLRQVQSLSVAPPPVLARSTSPRLDHQRIPVPLTNKSKSNDALQETDFPLEERPQSLNPSNSLCCAAVEQAFDYLEKHDDDDDVINVRDSKYDGYDENYDENPSDGDDSVDTIDLDAAPIHSRPSTNDGSSGIGSDHRHDSEEKLTEYPLTTNTMPGGPMSEDNDSSDFENQSHEDEMDDDDEPMKEDLVRQQIEQKKQLFLRQQKIMWIIEQEWIRKEKTFIDELEKLAQFINGIPAANALQNLIQNLLPLHRKVQREVELLSDRDQQSSHLLRQIAQATNTLMLTLQYYDEFMKEKLSNLRKALEKRTANNGPSSEDLLSVLPRQYLQILSQVQDLYKTAQSFDSDDDESRRQLFNYAHECKMFGSRQDENINKVILKEDDVGVLTNKGTRERCHIILYPDALIGCILKTSLLTSPKYTLAWHVSIIDLTWKISTQVKTDSVETGDDLKSNLKSAYQELEKASTPTVATSRLRKIRKQENEYNLAHSNLPLTLENPSQSVQTPRYTILFSSAYQRQEWIDLLEKTKRELTERSSALADPINTHNQRLKELVQKRLESIKPTTPDSNVNDGSAAAQSRKTYSGTLNITIYSLQGLAISHPTRVGPPLSPSDPTKYQFYVAVEIDSYNTFHPYAQTSKRPMQNNDAVEFRGEAFQVELEYSQAFRLIIYRLDTTNPQSRAQCIGKFHRNIENALRECDRQLSGVLTMESPNDDLKLKISLKYAKRDGTFRRQPSKRNKAIFGKSIEILMSTSNGIVDGIPRIIVKCIEMVDREGFEETGIYRVCCVTSDLQKLRHEFDRQPLRAEEMLTGKSVHVAANLLKLFFRELPEPLFTSSLYQQFVHATQLTDIDNRRVTLLNTLELLHPDNRRILLYLLDHLLRISEYSHINMMHLENLAVVFGPTLMRPSKLIPPTYFSGQGQPLSGSHLDLASESDQMSTELQGSMHQCQVVLAYLKLRRDGLLK